MCHHMDGAYTDWYKEMEARLLDEETDEAAESPEPAEVDIEPPGIDEPVLGGATIEEPSIDEPELDD